MRWQKLLACLILALLAVQTSESFGAWPRHRTPSASVLAPARTPYYGYGNPAPYRWGWFGAEYHTRRIDQSGFYPGTWFQYGYWQGYH